jgi:hypothetical protein
MENLQSEVTKETIAYLQKATTTGFNAGTGYVSYDLDPRVLSLIPVVTPFRDFVSRKRATDGAKFAMWRATMNATSSQPDPSMGYDYAAGATITSEQDFQAVYKPTGLSDSVTLDAINLAQGLTDPYAISQFNTLNYVLIGDDRKLIGGQSFALSTAAAPTLVGGTSGSIGAVSSYWAAAPRTGSGYYYGSGNGRGTSSLVQTFGSGTTNSITATVAAVRGAVAYDWFYSANGTTGWLYYTTTTVNTALFTTIPSVNATPPNLPQLSANWKGAVINASTNPITFNAAADNGSANANDYDGFLATLSGDYNAAGQFVQAGTSTANPSVWASNNGAALTLSGGTITEIVQKLFLPLYNQALLSPSVLMMNQAQAYEIATLVLGSTAATTFVSTASPDRISTTAGGRVGKIINPFAAGAAGGIEVAIEIHPNVPPGTIIARSDEVPYPNANIDSVLEYRNLQDTQMFEYGVSLVANTAGGGPRKQYELRSLGAFVNRAPVANGVLSNVG